MPHAALMAPKPSSPQSSRSSASTGTKTSSAPATRVWAETSETISRARGSETTARAPALTTCSTRSDSAGEASSASAGVAVRIPARSSADQRNVPAAIANETPGPLTAMTTPPRAGPAKAPTLSIVLEATFAAVSSSGDRASEGKRAAWAGRNAVPAAEASAASA